MGVRLRPRLLPLVAIAATMLLGFKVSNLALGISATVAPAARAQGASASQAGTAAPSQPAKPAVGAPATPSAPDTASSTQSTDPQSLNPSEIEVLQQLAQRRAELDQRAGELDQRDVLLQAAEKRIDDKIAKLQELQNSIASDVQKRSAEDDARIQSLVKIYEAMKPKDAAQIFEQLDMPVLMSVLPRMKELKTAPILAAMDPVKAKTITTALAAKRSPDTVQSTAKTPTGAPAPKL
jgi:flagellar motility protein MotE (MotC chaperone)